MAIRTGIGIGAAQIADTSNIMNAYGRQIAQQQKEQAAQAQRDFIKAEKEAERVAKEQAKFDENLADIMASVKTEGARDVDVPDITKAYSAIKDMYAKSGSLKDSEKPLFRAELRNKINSLNEFAQRSNKLSKDVLSISEEIAKNEWDYDPKSVLDIKEISRTPLAQLGPRANIDRLNYKRQANPDLIIKAIDNVYKRGEENAEPSGQIVDKSGLRYSLKRVSPEFISNALAQEIQNNPEAMQSLAVLYRRTTGDNNPTNEKLTAFLKDQYETRHKYDYLGNAIQPRSSGGGGDDAYNFPIELNLPFGQESEKPGVVNVKDYIKLPLTKQNFAGSGYIDMSTGLPATGTLESSNDYEVVGVANFPVIAKDFIAKGKDPNGQNIKGALAQPRFIKNNPSAVQLKPMVHVQKITDGNVENLLIPYDRLPASKKTIKGLANFRPASGSSSSAPKTSATTKESSTQNKKTIKGF